MTHSLVAQNLGLRKLLELEQAHIKKKKKKKRAHRRLEFRQLCAEFPGSEAQKLLPMLFMVTAFQEIEHWLVSPRYVSCRAMDRSYTMMIERTKKG